MKKFFYLLALMMVAISASAQKSGVRRIILVAKITDPAQTQIMGYIHSVTDSGMNLMDVKQPVYTPVDKSALFQVSPDMIEAIKIRKKGQAAKGLGIGLVAGAGIGALIGLASYQDPGPDAFFDFGPGLSALGGAIVGTIVGGITGGAVGSKSKKFKLKGDKQSYARMQSYFYNRISRNPTYMR